jgi:hypothetical protein
VTLWGDERDDAVRVVGEHEAVVMAFAAARKASMASVC